jgi:uncharacterized protein VirK/YbjX
MDYWLTLKSLLWLNAGVTPRALKNQLKVPGLVARNRPALESFSSRMSAALGANGLQTLGTDCLGVVQWPYVSKAWGAEQRLGAIASHYETVTQVCPLLLLSGRNETLKLADLSEWAADCSLVLDRPKWFMREGELVLNLFQDDLRIASLAFTLCRTDIGTGLFIGAVQGIHKGVDSDRSLAIYRDLTKAFEGLRPRSLLIEVIKHVALRLGVDRLYAVGDEFRHHRHPYFGAQKAQELAANYDVIWLEHGATPSEREDFFDIPLAPSIKPLDTIAAKKRAMYRRRYELLQSTFNKVDAVLIGTTATQGAAPVDAFGIAAGVAMPAATTPNDN